MKSNNLICIVALMLLILVPAAGAVASLTWFDDMANSVCITAIDTNFDASLILVGLGNGTILAYDNNNTILWAVNTNASVVNISIKKIVADSNGNIAWINNGGQSGFISSTGARGNATAEVTNRNITDVAIDDDGTFYATTELANGALNSRLIIHAQDGTAYAQNSTYNSANWTKLGYDPLGEWIVTSNLSDDTLYFWNVSSWLGWNEFNPTHTASKNNSQLQLDSFTYRYNISLLGAATQNKGVLFAGVSNVSDVIKINNSYYFYNNATGKYPYWTFPGNLSNNQSTILNSSRLSGIYYYAVLNPNFTNYTFYFGNTTYTNIVSDPNYPTLFSTSVINITSSQTWTAPRGLTSVNVTIYGSGGGGASGDCGPQVTGNGGGTGSITTQQNVAVISGNTYPVVIGAPGTGGAAQGTGFTCPTPRHNNGTNGGVSSFNTTITAAGGLGATAYAAVPAGQGFTGVAGYPSGGNGGTGWTIDCNGDYTYFAGSVGGVGFGAGGGGGGGGQGGGCFGGSEGGGGNGAPGLVQINFIATWDQALNSVLAYNFSKQTALSATSLNQSSSKDYVGTILGISVPRTGGIAGLVTSTIFYDQYLSNTGFGLFYCATLSGGGPALFAGTPFVVSSSNSGAASVEGRGAYGNVYDAGGIAKASSLTGGNIKAADSAMTSGVFVAFGGDEGKLYMLSRQGSSTWYSFFTGAAGTPYTSTAVSWDGAVVVAGRFGGTLEYYDTNVTIPVTPTLGFADASVYVFKDGAAYTSQPVTIYSSATDITNWTPITTLLTDGGGKITYTTTVGTYYKFVVNNVVGTTEGEASKIWQSNTASTTIYMYVLTPSTPYEWNAYYNAGTDNVTVVYSDTITPTSVTVTIKDLKTNLNVLTRTFTATKAFTLEYHDALGNGTYQVNILITRLGTSTRDQRIVTSPHTYGITLPVDNYIIWAISTIILMIIAGLFGYANSRRGALAVVVIAFLFMWFGLLPWTMVTIAMLAAIFAVMSLFASRVQ